MLNFRHNLVGLFLFRAASRNHRPGYTITRRRFTVFLYLACLACCAGCKADPHSTFRGDMLNIGESGLRKNIVLDRCQRYSSGESVLFELTETRSEDPTPTLIIFWPPMDTRHDVMIDSNGCQIRAWLARGFDAEAAPNDQARDAVASAERLHGYIRLEWKDGDSLPIVTVDIKGKTAAIVGRFERETDLFDIRPTFTGEIYAAMADAINNLRKETAEPPTSQPASSPTTKPAQ